MFSSDRILQVQGAHRKRIKSAASRALIRLNERNNTTPAMKPSIVSLLAGIAFSAVTSFALTNLASLVPSFPGTGADSQRDLGPMGRGLGKQVVRLYSSGVDDNGIVLPDGQPDPHYQLVEAPVGPLPLQPVTVDSSAWQFFVWVPMMLPEARVPSGSRERRMQDQLPA